jgi:Ni/Co efflux regulator RcnB
MDGRTRFYIIIAVILCVIALFLGSRDSSKKKSIEPKQVQTTKKTYVYEDNAPLKDEDQGGISQDVNFTKEELELTKYFATQFIKTYHNFDAAHPLQNIENSKKYTSDDFYQSLLQNPSRGTLDTVKKRWTEVYVTDTANHSKTKIIWNVVVQSENTNNDGVVELGEDWYLVQLEKVNNQYKVTGVIMNAPI